MNIFGFDVSWGRKDQGGTIDLDTLIRRLEMAHMTGSGVAVSPECAMESPTVQAIVTAISRRIASLPVRVLLKTESDGRVTKEQQPNHPVAKLLANPNGWQTPINYWLDAATTLVLHGNYYAVKGRGQTGPIRFLQPICPGSVCVEQDNELNVTYKVTTSTQGAQREYSLAQMHHARGPARDFLRGNSPVCDVREAIALEIAAEKFGGAFFGNGAMPFVVFQFVAGSKGFRTNEERQQFVQDFHDAYGKGKQFRAMVTPPGVEAGAPIKVENDKAQFLETRKLQRTIIAGAFGVPPHFVGDLSSGTFNNVEQQSLDFVQNVVLPYVRIFEAAMERDLLTPADRSKGIIIRFNLEGALRGDFKTRQEGQKIMREAGVITPNEWRENEGMNPLPDGQGGDTVWQQGPSGQGSSQPRQGGQEAVSNAPTGT